MVLPYPPHKSDLKLNFRKDFTFRDRLKRAVRTVLLFKIVILIISAKSFGQLNLHGMIVDSATMETLPHVNVTIKITGPGTVSDLRGAFNIKAEETDTLVFSRVGYKTKVLPAISVDRMTLILLKEERRMLDVIEVEDKKPSWLPNLPPVSAWRNQTLNKSFAETPGFQGIQTFGPGYVFRMPGSGFKKEALAKKRLQQLQVENDKARDYIHLVNSPEVKGKIMEDYGLSEEKFYELLASFNEKNGDFIYKLEGQEVIPLLLQFIADESNDLKK